MDKIQIVIDWFKDNWLTFTVCFIAFHTFLKSIRDAIDKTPATDDNWFERLVTVLGKAVAYLLKAKRAN